jgi:hypothetical protein
MVLPSFPASLCRLLPPALAFLALLFGTQAPPRLGIPWGPLVRRLFSLRLCGAAALVALLSGPQDIPGCADGGNDGLTDKAWPPLKGQLHTRFDMFGHGFRQPPSTRSANSQPSKPGITKWGASPSPRASWSWSWQVRARPVERPPLPFLSPLSRACNPRRADRGSRS